MACSIHPNGKFHDDADPHWGSDRCASVCTYTDETDCERTAAMLCRCPTTNPTRRPSMENETQEHIRQFFNWDHLPEHLREVSRPFALMADELIVNLPRNPERTVALRKLLEAKDAAVRAKLAK